MVEEKKLISLSLLAYIFAMFSASASVVSTVTPTLVNLEQESKALASRTDLESQRAITRWNHAKELLGKWYQKSVVKEGEEIPRVDELIFQWVERDLRGPWKKDAHQISRAILHVSDKYHFDPVFLIALIENESSFNPEAIGTSGEIGLMQLTPPTAEWIAKKYDLVWRGPKTLKNPITNIQFGAAYLAYLREKFQFRSQLYISAYNMGSSNVQRALDRQVWPKAYASRVLQRYVHFYSELRDELDKTIE